MTEGNDAADDEDGTSGEGTVRALLVDDGAVPSRLQSLVEREYDGVDVVATSDAPAARERLGIGDVDVLVVEPAMPGVDVENLVDWVDVPVVLYTDADPGEVDDAAFEAADRFVEKWTAEGGLDFVVEAIRNTARAGDDGAPTRLQRAFDPVEADGPRSSFFLVYDDGTVVWESASVGDLLEGCGVAVDVPGRSNLYKQLSALLAHDPATVRAIREPAASAGPTRFTVSTDGTEVQFRYTEHEFPESFGPVRLAVLEDVSWAGRADARLELLELLDAHVQDGISVVDAEGRIQYHNDSFAELLGREDMVGERAARFVAEGELAKGQQAVQRLLSAPDRDSEVVDLEFVTADGDRRTLAVHFAVQESDGEYAGLVNVARDVTDRVERERTLERYRQLVESAGDPMYVLDEDRRIALCNEAMATLFYAAESTLAGTPLADLLPDAGVDRIRAAIGRARETGESATCGLVLTEAPDDDRLFEATVAPLTSDGETVGSVGILHEVTERERRESELDLLKQVLARVLRHDVRTGLTVIRGQAEVIAERTTGDVREMAETVVDRSEELVETTEKVRAIERVIDGEGGLVTLDLRTVVNRAVANVAAACPDADCDVRITDQLPVLAHPALPHAVENLVENAVEHGLAGDRSERGGATASEREAPSVTVSATVGAEYARLHVADDGPGISQAELDVLDRREETPLKHGSGVGLWVVDWVVDRSGGDLSFDTGPEGTTVTVRLARGDPADVDVGPAHEVGDAEAAGSNPADAPDAAGEQAEARTERTDDRGPVGDGSERDG